MWCTHVQVYTNNCTCIHVHVTPVKCMYNFACVLACTLYVNMWLYVQSTLYNVVKCILLITTCVHEAFESKLPNGLFPSESHIPLCI